MTTPEENRDLILSKIGSLETAIAVLTERIETSKEHGERITKLEVSQARSAWVPVIVMSVIAAAATAITLNGIPV